MTQNLQALQTPEDTIEALPLELQVGALMEIIKELLDDRTISARVVKFKLQKYLISKDIYEKLYAINKLISNGNGIQVVPGKDTAEEAVKDTDKWVTQALTKRYVQTKLEEEVEKELQKKQDKYMDEIRLGIIKKEKGPENAKTLKKYATLEVLSSKSLSANMQEIMRPDSFNEIVGQDRAVKAILAKIASPYPQHIILYGPPGIGKTTAARLALEEAKKMEYTPFNKEAKFVEVDGSTLRWDPREITNPLLGSVHDPIYMGSKRDLAEVGIPEPKPGLVTEAHGGVLFIDEIGELDDILQNKLLKVLEDKKVQFSSSYYDPEDENVPKYIKYLFDNGAPADFILIGATTKEPSEINPALRSRCTEVYFEPLSPEHIEKIVLNASKKLKIHVDKDVPKIISKYTIQGRKAVNILADAYGYVLYNKKKNNKTGNVKISAKDLMDSVSVSRLIPYDSELSGTGSDVGHVYGLGVSGFIGSTIEIEATVFEAKEKGKGYVRFNDTAGSMAKDSVFNAATVIRKVTNKDICDYDVHVNVIGGGNIDGPSAGAAITICILSALENKPVRQEIAITGEISVRGKIKPVGGIFEKIYGAKRKGIKTVILPKDNLKEVPKETEDIKIISVDTIEELIKIAFEVER